MTLEKHPPYTLAISFPQFFNRNSEIDSSIALATRILTTSKAAIATLTADANPCDTHRITNRKASHRAANGAYKANALVSKNDELVHRTPIITPHANFSAAESTAFHIDFDLDF